MDLRVVTSALAATRADSAATTGRRSTLVAKFGAVMLLLLGVLIPIPLASARPGLPEPDGAGDARSPPRSVYFTLHSAANGGCLSYYPGADETGEASVAECIPFQNSQCWYMDTPGVKVKSTVDGHCLTVCQGDGCRQYPDHFTTQVIVAPCEKEILAYQNWLFNNDRLISEVNGDCLTQCTTCEDFTVVTYPCVGMDGQRWSQLPPEDAGTT